MKILNEEPGSWRELELTVARVLNGAGYKAYNSKQITTVRGNVNIDVLAEDENTIPKSTYIIECKYWVSDIPQTIIHSFRTIVNDYGAHHGLIIAKNRFQAGAYNGIKNTNIQLLNWEDFLNIFEERWLDESINNLHIIGQPLLIYTDPLDVSDYIDMLSQEEYFLYQELIRKYVRYAIHSNKLWYEYSKSYQMTKKEHIEKVINKTIKDCFENKSINCYNDYFQLLEENCLEGLAEFEKLFKKNGIHKYIKELII